MQPKRHVMSKRLFTLALGAGLVARATPGWAQAKPLAGQTVKIASIDPLSGLMGPVGQNQLNTLLFFAEKYSERNPAGVKFEVIQFDNKLSPTESLTALKAAIDQGARYIVQGTGSSVAVALTQAIDKHNERNPGKEVVHLNYAAIDPALTNEKCNYWHFSFDANTAMKMESFTTFIKHDPSVKKVYLLNQNYSHGQQVAAHAKEKLARKRRDIQIVGEDLHPLAQVRDFAPYIAKIRASGADAVITGNWGSDLALLVKAANEAGYNGKFFTYYAGVTGTPSAFGQNGAGRVYQVSMSHYHMTGQMEKDTLEFKKRFNEDFFTGSIPPIFEHLGQAMATAKSTDVVKVVAAMEGQTAGGRTMRKADHQLQTPLYVTVWQKADDKYNYSPENTGMTLAPVAEYPAYVSSTPTSCQMKRPS